MKLNWGTKLMLFFGAFIALILYMVYLATQQNTDLVATDYYARELVYQDKIDKQERANQLKNGIQIEVNQSGVEIIFPVADKASLPEGTVIFQRPSNKDLDRSFAIAIDSTGKQLLGMQSFSSGLYNVQLDWKDDKSDYYIEKKIIIP